MSLINYQVELDPVKRGRLRQVWFLNKTCQVRMILLIILVQMAHLKVWC
jgi:hypothetical protein